MITRRLALTAVMCGFTLLGVAPVASGAGVTNPAQHPFPITVTIDGQTYHDGLDTLPGYDDYECTPIPGVEYDFASNEVQYYGDDGNLLDTADWTEWSRISSYDTWKKQQGGTSTTSSSASKSGTSNATSGSAKSTQSSKKAKAKKAKTKKSTSSKTGVTKAKAKTAKAKKAKAKKTKAKKAKLKQAKTKSDTATASSSDNEDKAAAAGASSRGGGNGPSGGAQHGHGSTRLAGIGILAALVLAGVALVAGNAGLRKALDLRRPSSDQRDPKIVTT